MPLVTDSSPGPRSQTDDLLQSFRFRVFEEDGGPGFITPAAGFNNVVIPDITLEEVMYREGHRTFTLKFPGVPTVANTTYQRGVARSDTELFDWLRQGVLGKGRYRANHLIKQYDQSNTGENADDVAARQIHCKNVWPLRVKPMGDLDANTSDVSIMECECSVEEIELTAFTLEGTALAPITAS